MGNELDVSRNRSGKRVRRVLIFAYYFPPCGGGGVQRIAKFVRYLPEYGWQPTVVTVPSSYYYTLDDSLKADVLRPVEIIRTPQSARLRGPTLDAILWCTHAVAAGLRAHNKRPFDLIYATGEPFSNFFIARLLSRLTGVRFLVDMRDPWTLDRYQTEQPSALHRQLAAWEERRVLRACCACVFANPARDLYAELFPQWAHKFHYLPNGYDSADLDEVEPRRFDKFTIVHSGSFLSGYRTAGTFLFALQKLLQARPAVPKKLQVLFVGRVSEEEKQLIDDLSLGTIVRQIGYVPHLESIAYLKGADMLLLIGGRHRWEETGKIYEYFATGKPILSLVRPDGAAADLLRRYPRARIIDRENIDETTAALSDIASNGFSPSVPLNQTCERWIAQYDRKQLTRRLALIFERCIPGSDGKT